MAIDDVINGLSKNATQVALASEKLAPPVTSDRKYTDRIVYNLEQRGYSLMQLHELTSKEELPLPELVDHILRVPKAIYVNGLPIILSTASEAEIGKVTANAQENGSRNPIGYLFETIARLYHDKNLQKQGELLHYQSSQLVPPEKREWILPADLSSMYIDYLKNHKRTPIARKWNVVDFPRETDFLDTMKTYLK